MEVAGLGCRQEQALEIAATKVESAVAVPLASATLMKRATAPASNLFLLRPRLALARAVTVFVVIGVVRIVLVVVVVMVV